MKFSLLQGWRPVLAERPDALLYPTVHFGPPYTRDPVRSAARNAYSATARHVDLVTLSVR